MSNQASKVVTGRIAALRVSPQLADMHDVLFLLDEIERLRAALKTIACWHVAWPENNYPGYAGMAITTARNAFPDTYASETAP